MPLRVVLMALTAALAACGEDEPSPAPPPATSAAPSAAEQRAIARVRAFKRAHHSRAALAAELEGRPPAERRRVLVAHVEREVFADARRLARSGRLDGVYRGARCLVIRPDRKLLEKDAATPVLRYDCVAYRTPGRTNPPVLIGAPYEARVDIERRRYAWCREIPAAGEGLSNAETYVYPPAACSAAP